MVSRDPEPPLTLYRSMKRNTSPFTKFITALCVVAFGVSASACERPAPDRINERAPTPTPAP